MKRWAGLAIATAILLAGCGGADEAAPSASASASGVAAAGELLEAQRLTVLDQPVQYPKKKPAEISSSLVQLEPGQESGWRKHKVPTFVHVLEGSISVEYDAGVTQEYSAGTSFMQAVDVWYDMSNKGESTARLLVVTMGAKGIKSTLER